MLMGQMLISGLVALTAATISVLSGNGVLVTLAIYSGAGSLSLLTLALMICSSGRLACDHDRQSM